MAGFYYWFPEPAVDGLVDERAGKLRTHAFTKYQCEYLFDDREIYPDQVIVSRSIGPAGGPGVLVYPKPAIAEELPLCIYNPPSQQWVPFRNYWIGWEKESPPKVQTLAKRKRMIGIDLVDDQGETWIIPVIRAENNSNHLLSRTWTFDSNGQMVSQLVPKHQRLWEVSGIFMDVLAQGMAIDDMQLNLLLVEILQANYYVGVGEIHALGESGKVFLCTSFAAQVMSIATEFQAVMDFQKKISEPV